MSQKYMPEASHVERLAVLRDNADQTEEGVYIKALTPEEIYARREQLSDMAIQLAHLEEEKKALLAAMKEKIDAVRIPFKETLLEIKTGQVEIEGPLYLMANHSEGMMEYYDEHGDLIKTRRLLPQERQQRFAFDMNTRRASNE